MRTDPARSRARKARRVEKAAENEKLAYFVNPEAGVIYGASEQSPEVLPGSFGGAFMAQVKKQAKPRRSKPRRKKSPTLSKLKKLLWTEISLLVRSWSPVCLGCLSNPTECAGHVVPANSGGATAYFLANLVPMCFSCNGAELRHRGEWVYRFKAILGDDVVDALYQFNKESKDQSNPYFWQVKKWWVLEQTERMRKLRGA